MTTRSMNAAGVLFTPDAAACPVLRTRVLVIGSGVAGLHAAWRAARSGDVVLLTKRTLFDSATAYAQGGIAAALGAGDSPALHRSDTLAAGAALCDGDAVDVLVTEGPARVRQLVAAGARFDLDPHGGFTLGREAAHSARRIVHARGDQTGAEVAATLAARVRGDARITVLEHTRALELIVHRGECMGVRALQAGTPVEIVADATVLATGGCGQLYRYTTNPAVSTGDGFALAHRAGAALADMEFVQFHPTALESGETPLVLISEAVRGEGALLVDDRGDRFMPRVHELAELAPRDVVSREVFRVRGEGRRVLLDATHLGAAFERRFPGIFALCRARGVDPRAEPIPVTPAAHYVMGGVAADLAGRTSLPRLWACGEVASTGVHGANRLASNSLLEGLVFAERVARDVGVAAPLSSLPPRRGWTTPPAPDAAVSRDAVADVRDAMWEHAGIVRSAEGLRACLERLDILDATLPAGAIEERNMIVTGRLITRSALLREESRGGHYRTDHPRPERAWEGRHIRMTTTPEIAARAAHDAASPALVAGGSAR
ncbi:MAG TPA: L-aspartate oxidase [Gemmatimonadaceae bacterium]|nr:L-aspartate oxidase [Gemmatimonadaceae bacterium]